MKTYSFQIIKLIKSEYEIDFSFSSLPQGKSVSNRPTKDRTSIEIIEDTSLGADFNATWFEERKISGIFQNNEIKDIVFTVLRKAGVRIIREKKILYSIGLQRQYNRAIKAIWPQKQYRPFLKTFRFDLKKFLNNKNNNSIIRSQVSDIVIYDLPIEKIPSAALKINSCEINDINSLVQGTNARIIELSIYPRGEGEVKLNINRKGKLKVHCDFLKWNIALDLASSILDKLNLLEEQ